MNLTRRHKGTVKETLWDYVMPESRSRKRTNSSPIYIGTISPLSDIYSLSVQSSMIDWSGLLSSGGQLLECVMTDSRQRSHAYAPMEPRTPVAFFTEPQLELLLHSVLRALGPTSLPVKRARRLGLLAGDSSDKPRADHGLDPQEGG